MQHFQNTTGFACHGHSHMYVALKGALIQEGKATGVVEAPMTNKLAFEALERT